MDVRTVVEFNDKDIRDTLIAAAVASMGKDVVGLASNIKIESANGNAAQFKAIVSFNGKGK